MRGHKVSLVDLIRDGEGNGCRPSHPKGREGGGRMRKGARSGTTVGRGRRTDLSEIPPREVATALPPAPWPLRSRSLLASREKRLSINLRFEGRRPGQQRIKETHGNVKGWKSDNERGEYTARVGVGGIDRATSPLG